jgi:glycosyltransferase involved in cell wall biosynthesis
LVRVAVNLEQLLFRAPGGIGRYTAQLATLLPRLFPEDTLVPFVAWHRRQEIQAAYRAAGLLEAGTPAPIRLPLPRPILYDSWHLLGGPQLRLFSPALGRVDLIHAPSTAVPPAGSRPLVVSIHDMAYLLFPETYPRRGLRFHAQGIRAATRRADLVITGSRAAAEEIDRYTDISPERVRIVPYGVSSTVAGAEEVTTTLARFDLAGRPYVLWVGSLEPRKNVTTLVMAFARLVAGGSWPHRLVLAGPSGWLVDGLIPDHERHLLGDRLRLVGRVSDVDLRALYAGAEVFAFPSRHEGFGLPVLEAMAQGTPVLCADIPALREVTDGAARLVPATDVGAWHEALEEVLGDDRLRSELASAGRKRVGDFSWERMTEATHAVYCELVNS